MLTAVPMPCKGFSAGARINGHLADVKRMLVTGPRRGATHAVEDVDVEDLGLPVRRRPAVKAAEPRVALHGVPAQVLVHVARDGLRRQRLYVVSKSRVRRGVIIPQARRLNVRTEVCGNGCSGLFCDFGRGASRESSEVTALLLVPLHVNGLLRPGQAVLHHPGPIRERTCRGPDRARGAISVDAHLNFFPSLWHRYSCFRAETCRAGEGRAVVRADGVNLHGAVGLRYCRALHHRCLAGVQSDARRKPRAGFGMHPGTFPLCVRDDLDSREGPELDGVDGVHALLGCWSRPVNAGADSE
mmetsp:Transcript_42554/g.131394  ORF Transcript_42554/g.131394 Transcript_42554/m.131394 type:complete len:300 (+) Transcript_42554:2689-3588(+)